MAVMNACPFMYLPTMPDRFAEEIGLAQHRQDFWQLKLDRRMQRRQQDIGNAAVRAQDENADPESKEGRPLDGYLGTITLMLLALFIVGKSARR